MSDNPIRIHIDGDRPRAVFDPNGPGGETIDTPVEHRLLWWIRDNLTRLPRLPPTRC